jgi:D-glycero-D-manno-heptose 1,7-bisphosphate phosphatase
MARLIVFDADHTLRRTTVAGQPCPHGPGEWELMPGVREVLSGRRWWPHGPRLAVASNQDHVGYGLITPAVAESLLLDMVHAATGGVVDPVVAFCPHRIEEGCACRKPAPGLLHRILGRLRIAPADALFVGDAAVDEAAAAAVGMPFRWAWDFFGARPDTWHREGVVRPR